MKRWISVGDSRTHRAGILRGLALLLVLALCWAQSAARAQDKGALDVRPARAAANDGSLGGFLGLVPDLPNGLDDLADHQIWYADIAAQLAAFGATAPTSPDDPAFPLWHMARQPLPLFGPLPGHVDIWPREVFGFDIFQVDQFLALQEHVLLLRGRFDEAEVQAAWERTGYRHLDFGESRVWSIRGDFEVDSSSEQGRDTLFYMNYAAVLPDGTLAFASAEATLRAVLAVATEDEPALADRPEIAAVVDSLPAELVAAMLLHGEWLRLADMERVLPRAEADAIVARVEATGAMPEIRLVLAGVTAGGPLFSVDEAITPPAEAPRACFLLGLLFDDEEAADEAAPIVRARLDTLDSPRTREPYAENFPERAVNIAADAPVVLVELGFPPDVPINHWLSVINARDLLFVAW